MCDRFFPTASESMKVLIADDSHISRALLSVALSRWGYEVIEAADGDQAWKVLADPDPPRLAILDWVMPGMTGQNSKL